MIYRNNEIEHIFMFKMEVRKTTSLSLKKPQQLKLFITSKKFNLNNKKIPAKKFLSTYTHINYITCYTFELILKLIILNTLFQFYLLIKCSLINRIKTHTVTVLIKIFFICYHL